VRDIVPALLAISALGTFLGVLVWHVPRTDLTTVIAITFLLAAADLALTARDKIRASRRRNGRP